MRGAIVVILLTVQHGWSMGSPLSDAIVRHAEAIQRCVDESSKDNLAACAAGAVLEIVHASPSKPCAAQVHRALRCASKHLWPPDINPNSSDALLAEADLDDDFGPTSVGTMKSVNLLSPERAGPWNHIQAERRGEVRTSAWMQHRSEVSNVLFCSHRWLPRPLLCPLGKLPCQEIGKPSFQEIGLLNCSAPFGTTGLRSNNTKERCDDDSPIVTCERLCYAVAGGCPSSRGTSSSANMQG